MSNPNPQSAQEDIADTLRVQAEDRLAECARHIAAGVVIIDPATTFIGAGIEIGAGTVIQPNTTITGPTVVGKNCEIGPNTVIRGSRIGSRCSVFASVVDNSDVGDGVDMGPYSHMRPGTRLAEGVHIGNFVEVKASSIGRNSKAGHFSYIGDAQVGENVNIGAGTVTCNYDGEGKHQTVIEDGVFVGSDTMLVAPVRLGRGSATGAGAVVTKDVQAGGRVAGVPAKPLPTDNSDG